MTLAIMIDHGRRVRARLDRAASQGFMDIRSIRDGAYGVS
jgi:hypothetical protein